MPMTPMVPVTVMTMTVVVTMMAVPVMPANLFRRGVREIVLIRKCGLRRDVRLGLRAVHQIWLR